MADLMLQIDNLQKSYRSHWTFQKILAVQNVTLSVARGEAFGFLGSNGAGKTTTIKCITGLIKKSSGVIIVDGIDSDKNRSHQGISYLPEQPYFYDHLNVEETLDFLASLYGIAATERKRRIIETLETVGLEGRRLSSVRSLSKGLQQRLNLAQAIINKPKLLLLDEPFSGMDPLGRIQIRNILLNLKKDGTTIFMSSHILSDVEDICDRVSVMSKGEIKTIFRLDEIPRLYGEKYRLAIDPNSSSPQVIESLRATAESRTSEHLLGNEVEALIFKDYEQAKVALNTAAKSNISVFEFRGVRPRLEEIFISLTKGNS